MRVVSGSVTADQKGSPLLPASAMKRRHQTVANEGPPYKRHGGSQPPLPYQAVPKGLQESIPVFI